MSHGSKGESLIYILSGSALSLTIVNWWSAGQAILLGVLGGFGGFIGRWLFGLIVEKVKSFKSNKHKSNEEK